MKLFSANLARAAFDLAYAPHNVRITRQDAYCSFCGWTLPAQAAIHPAACFCSALVYKVYAGTMKFYHHAQPNAPFSISPGHTDGFLNSVANFRRRHRNARALIPFERYHDAPKTID